MTDERRDLSPLLRPFHPIAPFSPACPRCGDLLAYGALICPCGCRVTIRSLDPKRRTVHNHRMRTTNAAHMREDVQAARERES